MKRVNVFGVIVSVLLFGAAVYELVVYKRPILAGVWVARATTTLLISLL